MAEAEVLIKTDDARVRIMSLSPHETNDWHFHTEVTDDIFCLTGRIQVCTKDPEEEIELSPGQRVHITAGRHHQVGNPVMTESTYLLVQGIGKYDFNTVKS